PSRQSPLLITLSGNYSSPLSITSSSNKVYLHWSFDHTSSHKGFRIRYTDQWQAELEAPAYRFASSIWTTLLEYLGKKTDGKPDSKLSTVCFNNPSFISTGWLSITSCIEFLNYV
ncbi:CUB and sushi domain-containing protein 1, partial [Tachysurus ichikawai]